MITRAGVIYLASLAVHGALAIGLVSLRGPKKFEDVSISMVETKKKEKPNPKLDEPPPEPEPEPEPAPVKAKAAPAPAPANVAPAPANAAPAPAKAAPTPVNAAPAPAEVAPAPAPIEAAPASDFGLSLGGATGPGLAVGAATARPVASAAPPVHKVLTAAAPAARCDEPPKKPRPISISQPAYTAEARTASIAGKVRVEITVDETGHVTKVRVLEGLGYGLDEAALAAARAATFEPGTLCGKPATTTFTVAMRFTL